MNCVGGHFELIGFVPVPSDDLLHSCGIKKANYSLARATVLNQCIYVVLLYGGMMDSSPHYVVEGVSKPARNFLGLVRADHVARLEMLQHTGVSRILPGRYPACRSHLIRGDELSVVRDADSVNNCSYSHNQIYKKQWRYLLFQLDSAPTRAAALKTLQSFGWRPLLPALFCACGFDGAVDFPEDIHHLGPLGIGLSLLQWLLQALSLAFPSNRCKGHTKSWFFPTDASLLQVDVNAPVRALELL